MDKNTLKQAVIAEIDRRKEDLIAIGNALYDMPETGFREYRSSAYAARRVAKTIVKAGLADRCEVQLSYAIGVSRPISVMIDTFGTGKVSEDKIVAAVNKCFDLRPAAIIDELGLRNPIYSPLAAYGHMGREELGVAWENTDKAEILLDLVK